jgi:protein-tyrosine phosphatase
LTGGPGLADRRLELEGASNFRDLGGYPARDGRQTRWGVVFRSDALHWLTASDLVALQEYDLRTVLDLRTYEEVARSGPGPLDRQGVGYFHLSVLDREGGESAGVPAPAGDDLAERYLWYLDVGKVALVEALATMADRRHHPVVFHCSAGKDRTGVLSALLLALLGVDHETIVQDYSLTAAAMDRIVARLRQDSRDAARLDAAPPSRLVIDPWTMTRFLQLLEEHHGGALAWSLGAGLDGEAVARLHDLLLVEPAGG